MDNTEQTQEIETTSEQANTEESLLTTSSEETPTTQTETKEETQSENDETETKEDSGSLLTDTEDATKEDEPIADLGEDGINEYVEEAYSEDFDSGLNTNGVKQSINKDDFKSMANVLHKAGVKAKDAASVMQAVAELEKSRSEKAVRHNTELRIRMIDECKEAFGVDLKNIARKASKGGQLFFGDAEWKVLSQVPELCNRPDFIRALARYAQAHTPDGGVGGKQSSGNTEDFYDKWVKASPLS